MSTNQDTRATAEELLRRYADGDPEHCAQLFAEPVDWQLAWPSEGHPAVPWIKSRSTRADVADHFRVLTGNHFPERTKTSVTDILVDGSDAVVFGHLGQTARSTNISYTSPFVLRLTVKDGLITRFHFYEDSLTVARALSGVRDA